MRSDEGYNFKGHQEKERQKVNVDT